MKVAKTPLKYVVPYKGGKGNNAKWIVIGGTVVLASAYFIGKSVAKKKTRIQPFVEPNQLPGMGAATDEESQQAKHLSEKIHTDLYEFIYNAPESFLAFKDVSNRIMTLTTNYYNYVHGDERVGFPLFQKQTLYERIKSRIIPFTLNNKYSNAKREILDRMVSLSLL